MPEISAMCSVCHAWCVYVSRILLVIHVHCPVQGRQFFSIPGFIHPENWQNIRSIMVLHISVVNQRGRGVWYLTQYSSPLHDIVFHWCIWPNDHTHAAIGTIKWLPIDPSRDYYWSQQNSTLLLSASLIDCYAESRKKSFPRPILIKKLMYY